MARIYETLSGREIRYDDPSKEVEAFLEQVNVVFENKRNTENDLVELIYGSENPILEKHPLFPDRGYVTRAVLENPVYEVLADLLVRKQVARAGVDPESLGKRFTATVAEAAERLGISEAAVRKAVQDKRLPAWKREGKTLLDPKTFHSLKVGVRGGSADGGPLRYRVGYDEESKATFRLRVAPAPKEAPEGKGTILKWRRGIVLVGAGGSLRAFLIQPADAYQRIERVEFFVDGKFKVTMNVNNAKAAREAWEAFSND